MKRYLEEFIRKDLKEKIVLLSGPSQVGKTTLSRQLTASHFYFALKNLASGPCLSRIAGVRDRWLCPYKSTGVLEC
jgi:Holliday junction resolvasome RuvABC ATP-dependent DNA helicase subunit